MKFSLSKVMAALRKVALRFLSRATILQLDRPAFLYVQQKNYQSIHGSPRNHQRLFIPGPLTTSDRVKQALLRDVATRHPDFEYVVKYVRKAVLDVAGLSDESHTVIPIQGSGTTANECAISSLFGRQTGKVVIMENGTYGKRMAQLCLQSGIDHSTIPMSVDTLRQVLEKDQNVIGVVVVHCETSTGAVNPIAEIGEVVKQAGPDIQFLVDCMTSFGAIPVDMSNVDMMTSSACKNIQGAPGISFVLATRAAIERCRGRSRSTVLDLPPQHDSLERDNQFRFTPPSHVMLAFREALLELEDEGGVKARAARYKENAQILRKGMTDMGFELYLDPKKHPLSYIVTTFKYPTNSRFIFPLFHTQMCQLGHILSPLQTNLHKTFRVSTIGHLYPYDVHSLLRGVRKVCYDMGISLPLQNSSASNSM